MGSNRHQVGGLGVVILTASFMAGMMTAVAVCLDPASWRISEPYFGLAEEMSAPVEVALAGAEKKPALMERALGPVDVAVAPPTVDAPPAPSSLPQAPLHAPPVAVAPSPQVAATPAPKVAPVMPTPAEREPTLAEPPPPQHVAEPTSAPLPTPPATPSPLPAVPQLVPLTPRFAARPMPRRVSEGMSPLVSVAGESERPSAPVHEAVVTDAPDLKSLPAAPLPGANWSDPDGVNWFDAAESQGQPEKPVAEEKPSTPRQSTGARVLDRIADRFTDGRTDRAAEGRAETPPPRAPVFLGERLRSRLRGEPRAPRGADETPDPAHVAVASDGWPAPLQLLGELDRLVATSEKEAGGAIARWAQLTIDAIQATLRTNGPADPRSAEPLVVLSERVNGGMAVADQGASPMVASQTRRAALAVARRVAVWRAAAAWCSNPVGSVAARGSDPLHHVDPRALAEDACLLLACLERYETSASAADAATVRMALAEIADSKAPAAAALARAVSDHYHAANVRIAVHREFVSRMLPESTVTTNAVQDYVLGRPVKGRSTVEQSLAIRFVPHPTEVRMELVVNGEVASNTVTNSGPVSIHSRGQATFTVYKPFNITASGITVADARGTASSNARLASIETRVDKVPIMGELVHMIAKKQHDDARQEANREVSNKVLGKACRQVDKEAEPKLAEMAEKIREKAWNPLVTLGLEPTPVGLETTEDVASIRLRLAAGSQLAAHTPRPRAPNDALVSFQVHETVANNALGQFGFAGQQLDLPGISRLVCEKLGLDPQVPEDLPEDVVITFAKEEPLRLECRDGLIRVRVALDTFACGRRTWYDVIAKVTYRPVSRGAQVTLEREGPVQISGPGHEGRMEIGLRTIFGKIFAQSRPIPLVPLKVTENPALTDLMAVQAVATDGWLAIALAEPQTTMTNQPPKTSPTAKRPAPSERRSFRR